MTARGPTRAAKAPQVGACATNALETQAPPVDELSDGPLGPPFRRQPSRRLPLARVRAWPCGQVGCSTAPRHNHTHQQN